MNDTSVESVVEFDPYRARQSVIGNTKLTPPQIDFLLRVIASEELSRLPRSKTTEDYMPTH